MVSILMAVYNGEMYLQEQLNSIESQTVRDWNLIVRDDGSSDQTKEIIREFAGRVSQKVVLLDSDSDKHGPKYNFFALLNETQDSYIMFCDQDDVWKKDKIEKTVAKMQSIEKNAPGTPVLVHTDLEVVDAKGNTISKSFFDSANLKKNPSTAQLLLQNHVTGCTVMINKALLSYVQNLEMPYIEASIMHDYWLALVAKVFGKIELLSDTTIYYRQHEDNSVGAKNSKSIHYLWKRLRDGKEEYKKSMQNSYKQVSAFVSCYEKFGRENKYWSLLKTYAELENKGKVQKWIFFVKYHAWKQGLVRKIMQILWG